MNNFTWCGCRWSSKTRWSAHCVSVKQRRSSWHGSTPFLISVMPRPILGVLQMGTRPPAKVLNDVHVIQCENVCLLNLVCVANFRVKKVLALHYIGFLLNNNNCCCCCCCCCCWFLFNSTCVAVYDVWYRYDWLCCRYGDKGWQWRASWSDSNAYSIATRRGMHLGCIVLSVVLVVTNVIVTLVDQASSHWSLLKVLIGSSVKVPTLH